MGKPRCLQHNHFIVVIYLEAPWAGSEPHFAHCPQRGTNLGTEGTLMVLAAVGRMGRRHRERLSSRPRVSGRPRKTEPRAWCRLGSRDGVGRRRHGLAWCGVSGRAGAGHC